MDIPDLTKLHCGLYSCPLPVADLYMPEVSAILDSLPSQVLGGSDRWAVDVKVHMLMPGQWPCIPNWHTDFCPRDENGTRQPELRNNAHRMYLWVSGPPYPEFEDRREVTPRTWVEFDQFDVHRGTMSEVFCWRMFIRVAPLVIVPRTSPDKWLRRHTQVYLDAANFEW